MPRTQPHYLAAKQPIQVLIDADKYEAATAFALNVFSEYRSDVLIWVYQVKAGSIELTEKKKKIPPYIYATVVFSIFNTAQRVLDNFHEKTMKTFGDWINAMFKRNGNRRTASQRQLDRQLQVNLKKYAVIVRKVKGVFRNTLSFL